MVGDEVLSFTYYAMGRGGKYRSDLFSASEAVSVDVRFSMEVIVGSWRADFAAKSAVSLPCILTLPGVRTNVNFHFLQKKSYDSRVKVFSDESESVTIR